MPGAPDLPPEIPSYFGALLNIIAFLIAGSAAWYAYFVKGKEKSSTGDVPWIDARTVRHIGEDLRRLADSAEAIAALLKHEAEENEIQRRVQEALRKKKNDE